tara:strand:- start:266 stop:529 length:264 start_codon:yes stop_codon:yes gene_type:complete
MDLIIGFLVLIVLIPTNNVILNLAEKNPKMTISILTISMFANGILVLLYTVFMRYYASNNRLFIGGILIGVFISMIVKLNRLIKMKD